MFFGSNSRFFSNSVSVDLPDLGEGTKEATIKEWYVKPGDRVEEVSLSLINFNHVFVFSLMTLLKFLLISLLPRFLRLVQVLFKKYVMKWTMCR